MEKIITISNKEVKFKSTAGTLNRYRMQFKSDMVTDLVNLQKKMQSVKTQDEQFSILDLQIFEQMAWSMAKTADDSIPPLDRWLDEFDTFSIYEILPELSDLLIDNFRGINQKKNLVPQEVQKQN